MHQHISSGTGYSILQWIEKCFLIAGLNYSDHVIQSKSFVSNFKKLISNNATIVSLGYQPEVDFDQLAQLMMKAD